MKPMQSTKVSPISTTSVSVDFLTKTITVSRTFLNASRKVGSPEFQTMKRLTDEMPTFCVELKPALRCCCKRFQPTYNWMERYIQLQPNAQEMMDEFFAVRSLYRNYNQVRSWFIHRFPNVDASETLFDNTDFSRLAA